MALRYPGHRQRRIELDGAERAAAEAAVLRAQRVPGAIQRVDDAVPDHLLADAVQVREILVRRQAQDLAPRLAAIRERPALARLERRGHRRAEVAAHRLAQRPEEIAAEIRGVALTRRLVVGRPGEDSELLF